MSQRGSGGGGRGGGNGNQGQGGRGRGNGGGSGWGAASNAPTEPYQSFRLLMLALKGSQAALISARLPASYWRLQTPQYGEAAAARIRSTCGSNGDSEPEQSPDDGGQYLESMMLALGVLFALGLATLFAVSSGVLVSGREMSWVVLAALAQIDSGSTEHSRRHGRESMYLRAWRAATDAQLPHQWHQQARVTRQTRSSGMRQWPA